MKKKTQLLSIISSKIKFLFFLDDLSLGTSLHILLTIILIIDFLFI